MDMFLVGGGRIKVTPISTRNTNVTTMPEPTLTTPVNFTLQCSLDQNIATQTCPASNPEKSQPSKDDPETCPDYFRLIIKGGRVYVQQYKKSFQTRDVFTIWGIVQLLRMYPGQVPDLELLFMCDDLPEIWRRDYRPRPGVNVTWPPPPLFHYCGHSGAFDIVFPDWSFWGWPEINIREWNKMLEAISEGIKKVKWEEREPYAYWKGNARVGKRRDLMNCHDPMVHLYRQPFYFDFFTRSLVPMEHYWPIRPREKCSDIVFAVHWGNNNTKKAKAIGRNGSGYIRKNLKMKYVYDYMLHLLQSYGKLMKMNVEVPQGAKEVCPETMACPINGGRMRQSMDDSLVMSPSVKAACEMPPPFEEDELKRFLEKKESIEKEVEKWTNEYWEEQKKILKH
ncbi:Lipopolysaccharide-modifying protein [Arabidopsis suecica]|uniref:Lipopolysaccharide-modifying protein n=1 Tax=Arabidopsis suecica TaxID=45249 RepID=A0A8T2ALB2_ARASU|nr:Lipopolysaccharide-modifying protein [Arabidopsis suecica]